jgi:hypothetical protein
LILIIVSETHDVGSDSAQSGVIQNKIRQRQKLHETKKKEMRKPKSVKFGHRDFKIKYISHKEASKRGIYGEVDTSTIRL